MLRVCRAALGSGPDADDAWSETFLSAFVGWPDLAAGANVQAWLVRIAQRKSIDVIRRRVRDPAPVDVVPETLPAAARSQDRDIWHTVARLPEKQRLALAYHYFGGLSHVETATLIESTPDAVRRAAADGIKALRKQLRPDTTHSSKGAVR